MLEIIKKLIVYKIPKDVVSDRRYSYIIDWEANTANGIGIKFLHDYVSFKTLKKEICKKYDLDYLKVCKLEPIMSSCWDNDELCTGNLEYFELTMKE